MTVTVGVTQTVEVRTDHTQMVRVADDGTLRIYPGGMGVGPLLTMTVRDYELLRESADSAIKAARKRLEEAALAEWHGGA
jgi:hypothetical protein